MARLAQGEVVAIDGKTVRRSHDRSRGQQAIHLVSAWASANSMTLGQVKVERKSNEITAIPKLLGLLLPTGGSGGASRQVVCPGRGHAPAPDIFCGVYICVCFVLALCASEGIPADPAPRVGCSAV